MAKGHEPQRRQWSARQTELRKMLDDLSLFEQSIPLLLQQHAALHAAHMLPGSSQLSFEDEVFDGLSEEQFRRIPPGFEHSIAWCIWHIARIEDITMNLLVAGTPQVFTLGNWMPKLDIPTAETGNEMDASAVAAVSAALNMPALRAYRLEVGRRTQEIVKSLQPSDLKKKIAPSRLQQITQQGAVIPAAQGIIDFWGRHTVAGLLMMPATRHPFVHLNEALRIKQKQ